MSITPYARILIFSALYSLGSNMAHPVTPTLITGLGFPDYMFGVLFAAMSLGVTIFSPLWGRLGDRFGRVVGMGVSTAGYGLCQIWFGCATTELSIVLARFVGGSLASGVLVLQMACVIDLSDEKNRAARLTSFAAVNCVFTSFGFFLGGMLGTWSVAGVFYAQAISMVLLGILSVLLIPETIRERVAPAKENRLSPAKVLSLLPPTMLLLMLGVALANFGTYGFDNAFNYYIKRELGFPSSVNGIIKAVTGVLGLIATLGLNHIIIRRFDAGRALTGILILSSVSLLTASASAGVPVFFAFNMLFYLFNAMYQPIQQALIAEDKSCDFGLVSGMYQSARAVGMILGSLAAGFLYTVKPRLPFYTQAAAFLLAAGAVYAGVRLRRGGKAA